MFSFLTLLSPFNRRKKNSEFIMLNKKQEFFKESVEKNIIGIDVGRNNIIGYEYMKKET